MMKKKGGKIVNLKGERGERNNHHTGHNRNKQQVNHKYTQLAHLSIGYFAYKFFTFQL